MQHADQVAYLERMLRMVRTNTRDDGPGVSHTPVEGYYDPTRFQREVDLLFRRYPIVVGFSSQLRKAGDFVVHNDTGQPILVTRGTDGVLRAFLNVCRHRGAAVEQKPCGANKRAFVCAYHGWSYDLTGRLVGVTDGAAFGEIDKSKHGLRRLKVAEKYGLVWVVPTALEEGEDAGFDIDGYLGPLNAVAALVIAMFKATLVVLFFMHVKYGPRLTWAVVIGSVYWLGILLTLTLSDYLTRPHLGMPQFPPSGIG